MVVAVIPPDDARNQNQKSTEYDVECLVSDGQGNPAPQIYKSCVLGSLFATPGDYTKWALRAEKRDREKNKVEEAGSQVLVVCPNGLARAPIIVGAVPNPESPVDDKEDGYFFKFRFNGVDLGINKDGEFVIKRSGPTKFDGKPNDDGDKDKATTITLTKEGSITIVMGDDGKQVKLENKDADCVFTVGSGEKSAAVAEELKTLYGKLKDYVENAQVATGMGPSGTIIAMKGPGPQWDSNIESKSIKLPK